MKAVFRLVDEIGPDLDPEVWIELQKHIQMQREKELYAAFSCAAENMSAASSAHVEKVVQGERFE